MKFLMAFDVYCGSNRGIMKNDLISSIMTTDVVCVAPNQKIIDIKHIYQKKDFHHHIPVIEDNKLVGIVSLIDFMYKIEGAGLDDSESIYHQLTAKDIMTTNPRTLNEDDTVESAARILAKGDYHAIPIVKGEAVVGIVSTADIISYCVDIYAKIDS